MKRLYIAALILGYGLTVLCGVMWHKEYLRAEDYYNKYLDESEYRGELDTLRMKYDIVIKGFTRMVERQYAEKGLLLDASKVLWEITEDDPRCNLGRN